jgi:ppGpp synthetase/RelA/SpoT-type nucleotidyltranferase
MPELTEEQVTGWLHLRQELLSRAIDDIERLVEFFIADWGDTYGFSAEQVEGARIKDAPRVYAKALRRGLDAPDQLLQRCYRKDERDRFPVHDLLGVRVLVLSLNQVAAVKTAVESLLVGGGGDLYPLGNIEDVDIEDINASPRDSGYRALHVDGSVTMRVGDTDYTVPFELQVKTLAQHVYGQHTHEESYVPDEANEDPRYELVRGLQKALAEELNGVDLLLAELEDVAGEVRDDIARRTAGPEVSAASVNNAMRQTLGLRLGESETVRIVDRLLTAGVTATADFASLIDPSGDAAAEFAAVFEASHRRRPTNRELVDGLVTDLYTRQAGVTPEETPEQQAQREARLAEEPPASPLDELDPNIDLVPPEEEADTPPSAEDEPGDA